MSTMPATLDEAGRELAPAAALFANAVAVIGGATGLLPYALSLIDVEFNAWPAAEPLTVSLLGALMLGVAPGLWLIGRELLWEHSRTLVVPSVDGTTSQGASGRIRTCGTWYRKPVLYPLSYGGRRRRTARALRLPGGTGAEETGRRR